jgi:hypothetical protein
MTTPLDHRVVLTYHAMVDDKVVFEVHELGREDVFFLPPTPAGKGAVIPFEVSGDRFKLEVLAVGIGKDSAIRMAHLDPSWYANMASHPEFARYHVIRISPLPSS